MPTEPLLDDGVIALSRYVDHDNRASRGVCEHAGFVNDSEYRDDAGRTMVRYVWSVS